MKLGEKQEIFSESLCSLLLYAQGQGYGVRLRELERTPEQAALYAEQGKGVRNSTHVHSLAIDLYITVDGELQWDGEPYQRLGQEWQSYSEPGAEHCWGGDFRGGGVGRDVYHFSIKHQGVQ